MKFSPSTCNFYPDDIDYGDALPADAVHVPQEDYDAAMARPDGATITLVGERIAVYERAPTPFSELSAAYLGQVREKRERILNRLAGIGMAAQFEQDEITLQSVVDTRKAMLDITTIESVSSASDIQSLGSSVKEEYARIIEAASFRISNVFDGIDM